MRANSTTAAKLRAIRERAGFSMDAMAQALGYKGASSYQRYEEEDAYVRRKFLTPELMEKVRLATVGKGEPPVTHAEVQALAGISESALSVDIHRNALPKRMVAGASQNKLASQLRGERHEELEAETETIPVIGEVQAGAWREAVLLPEPEWREMRLPADPLYPGVPRYALRNVGESMNRECASGGHWVYIQLVDLAGIGPQPGDYVIVHRKRRDGLIEATCKKLEIRSGKPWLVPDSFDASFGPISLAGDEETEEITVIGIVTDVVNRPGRRR